MRCKACDEVMEPQEIIWVNDRHEPLCKHCRWLDRNNTIMYGEDTDLEYYDHAWRTVRDETDT